MTGRATSNPLGPLGRPPWLVRHGIWLMFGCTALTLGVMALIPYSDTATATIRFEGNDVVAYRSGRLQFAAKDGDHVRAGQRLALIANDANGETLADISLRRETLTALASRGPLAIKVSGGRESFTAHVTVARVLSSNAGTSRVVLTGVPIPDHATATFDVHTRNATLLNRIVSLAMKR